jgi:glycosyltransferase involved in cell wall biosynthesis
VPQPPLTVVLDARIRHGQTGGIESVVLGLASGLSALEGNERYIFLTIRGEDEWITPQLGGQATAVSVPDRAGNLVHRLRPLGEKISPLHALARRVIRGGGPPRSDGVIERIGAQVIHFVHQWGFLTDVPSIYHPHDLQHRHLPELFDTAQIEVRDRWYTALAQRAEMVAVASTWTRDDVIRELHVEAEKAWVIPWAPPLDVPAFSGRFPTPEVGALGLPSRYILYPAQTWPHKNHSALIRALALLASDGMTVSLVLTGRKNAGAPAIESVIERLGLIRQVKWLGFVEPSVLREVYRRATAVVIPSLFEAASGPLWEAFSAGVPAACSTVTSLPDQAGDAALLFDPHDTHAIAEAIRLLWTDDALRRKLVARGRERVSLFTWDRTARLFRAHYRRIASREMTQEDIELIGAPAGI